MSGIKFTGQQQQAIRGRGDALLVSAAAGSGKTAVLVERVLRTLENGGDIQRMIIMTFTEAAAAEMKLKIKKAVEELLQREYSDHLARQSTLIDSAEIGTIHSVCLNLITRNFERLNLDPRSRLLDETAVQAMNDEETEAYLEELFGSADPAICRFLECFASGKDEEGLKELLLRGLDFLEKQPLPEDYVRRALAPYRRTEQGLFACFSEDGLYRYLSQRLEELSDQYTFFLERMRRHPYFGRFPLLMAFLEEEKTAVAGLAVPLKSRNYDVFRAAVLEFKFSTLSWKKLTGELPEKEEKAPLEKGRDSIKEGLKALRSRLERPEGEELALLREQGALLETYFSLCTELKTRLERRRRKNGSITYQDMEQLAVRLLVEAYDPETDRLQPTELALQLREDYDEIIIDEFQDSNRAQDLIFRALSREGKNLFMVGDLKQSIYRFRGAEPEIFNQKRQQAAPMEQEMLSAPAVLELNANFRSHPGVLTFANRVCEAIMRPELGGVCYDERERLYPGRKFERPEEPRAELHWLQPETDEQTGRQQETAVTAARYAADLIERAVAEKQELLLPDCKKRPVEYRDFAILLRKASGTASVFERELQKRGIPVSNRNETTSFFDLLEVQGVLSYLMVLNNPYDDVALVSLLHGDFFRFTAGELAAIRHRRRPLFEDLCAAAEEDEKARAACAQIRRYRQLARDLYVYDLLYRIYQESGILAAYASEEGGAEKCANLELLAEDARIFEQEGYRGLYAFVQHIRISRTGVQSGAKLKAEENSVRIMTIHKSKGLEFPICILGDFQKTIELKDAASRILLHPRFGAAVEQINPEVYARSRSLAQEVLADQMIEDCVSEEERVLYVALTRPVSKTVILLHMSEKRLEGYVTAGVAPGEALPTWMLKKRNSYAGWLAALLAGRREGAALRKRFGLPAVEAPALGAVWIEGGSAAPTEKTAPDQKKEVFDRPAFRARLDWQYPHLSAVRLPAKLSVSELKGIRQQDEDAEPLLEERIRPAEPRFSARFRPRGSERGNALHQALQFSDFALLRQNPEEELARLVSRGFILESQRQMIPVEKIRRFTESACFRELMSADYYSKEERFLFPLPAADLFGAGAEGEILIQGVLDCYSVRGDTAVILDYKTDRVETGAELAGRYRIQLALYEQALLRTKGLRVVDKVLYSFWLEEEIRV